MGCNCGKNKKTDPQAKTPQQVREAQAQNRPTMAPAKGKTQSFVLEDRSGSTMNFGSRLEADAENVRRGYTGKVRPA